MPRPSLIKADEEGLAAMRFLVGSSWIVLHFFKIAVPVAADACDKPPALLQSLVI